MSNQRASRQSQCCTPCLHWDSSLPTGNSALTTWIPIHYHPIEFTTTYRIPSLDNAYCTARSVVLHSWTSDPVLYRSGSGRPFLTSYPPSSLLTPELPPPASTGVRALRTPRTYAARG